MTDWHIALALPSIALGTPIFNVVEQPGDCGPNCPCRVGPSDCSEYGMHWSASVSAEAHAEIDAESRFERIHMDAADRYREDTA